MQQFKLFLIALFSVSLRIRLDKFRIVEISGAILVMSNPNLSSYSLCRWLQIACSSLLFVSRKRLAYSKETCPIYLG